MTAATRVAGVAGWPVRHSLSPVMQNAAFVASGLDWVYVAFEVVAADAERALAAAYDLGLDGLSVTMPHKQAAAAVAVTGADVVRRLDAANTLVRGEHGWHADNTDVPGFAAFLATADVDVAGTEVGIVGAGGAAAAVAVAVAGAGAAGVRVWDPTATRAVRMLESTGVPGDAVADPGALAGCGLVVSCVPTDAVPAELGFSPGQVVVDLVYAPPLTPLLERAGAAGAETHNGLGLLVHQGALQFERWTARRAPLDVMWEAARAASGG